MITEDYVSFDTAILLKQRGFDEPIKTFYKLDADNSNEFCETDVQHSYNDNRFCIWSNIEIAAPTLALAAKWLREVHHIIIETNMDDYMTTKDGKLKVWYSYTIWTFIQHFGATGIIDCRYDDRAFWQEGKCNTYGEALEAGIVYCLENLIG